MATVTHPFTNDKPTLVEEYYGVGVWHFHVERSARYRRAGSQYKVRELFATVIALAAVDVNVAHILRGHFSHVEERLRLDEDVKALIQKNPNLF